MGLGTGDGGLGTGDSGLGTRDSGLGTRPGGAYYRGSLRGANGITAESRCPDVPISRLSQLSQLSRLSRQTDFKSVFEMGSERTRFPVTA